MGSCCLLESVTEERENIQQALKNAARLFSLCDAGNDPSFAFTFLAPKALGQICSAVSGVRCEDSPL